MCLLNAFDERALRHELTSEWFSPRPNRPWLLFLADRTDDFLSLCRVEHERAWIGRMFASISDHTIYAGLVTEYTAQGLVLGGRRRRVRNALVHGNPASFPVVESVREYAEFVSGSALYLALDSFVDATDPASALAERDADYIAIQAGQDAAAYWRDRVELGAWTRPE